MKKIIFTLMTFISISVTNAQFTINSTSVSFIGNEVPSATSNGTFYSYQPNSGFCDNSCSVPLTSCTVGGWDPNVQSGSSQTTPVNGVVFWGGNLRSIYTTSNSACVIKKPNFGFYTGRFSGGASSGTALDLSSSINNKIQFTYISNTSLIIELQLWNPANYVDKLSDATIALTGDGIEHTVTYNFSSNWIDTVKIKNDIKQVAFTIPQTTNTSSTTEFVLSNITLGSSVTTGVNIASDKVSQNFLFPNPTSEIVNLEMELKLASDIRVLISDITGKVMKTIAANDVINFSHTIDVSKYTQGLYVVGYYLNGIPVDNKLLMIR